MDDYRVKTIELKPKTTELKSKTVELKPRTIDMPKVRTSDFLPAEPEGKPNVLLGFLKGLFVNNWQIKVAAGVVAAVIWAVTVFV